MQKKERNYAGVCFLLDLTSILFSILIKKCRETSWAGANYNWCLFPAEFESDESSETFMSFYGDPI